MRGAVVAMIVCAAIAMLLGGAAPFGRVLLAAGAPRLAMPFFGDTNWRGVAHYRSGDMETAARDFRDARDFYNLGNAEAHLGNYAAALEAYDIAIAQGVDDAKANFDVVAAYYAGLAVNPDAIGFFPKRDTGPEAEGMVGQGSGRAAGTGDQETNASTMLGVLELDSRGRLGVRRVFDDKFMVADDRWLEQLSDVPGQYLKARISHEYKRRAKLGLTPEPPEDPR